MKSWIVTLPLYLTWGENELYCSSLTAWDITGKRSYNSTCLHSAATNGGEWLAARMLVGVAAAKLEATCLCRAVILLCGMMGHQCSWCCACRWGFSLECCKHHTVYYKVRIDHCHSIAVIILTSSALTLPRNTKRCRTLQCDTLKWTLMTENFVKRYLLYIWNT